MTLIIAEAGVNHNGSEEMALQLIDIASKANADIVKFQTFKATELVTKNAEKALYQISNSPESSSQLEMLKKLELSSKSYRALSDKCKNLGIEFLSTAFDSNSLKFLINDIGLKRLKIPSGEINNAPLILEHARSGLDIIISTGMANLDEIETALGVIAFGYIGDDKIPKIDSFREAYNSEEGQRALKRKVHLLHCVSEYPAPINEINLKAITFLKSNFNLPVGYSDHSEGINLPLGAVALGSSIIEKHFTISRNLDGPDHKASLEPEELKQMIKNIRELDIALGKEIKIRTKSEEKNLAVIRKSIKAKKSIKSGEIFRPDNLTIKRPGVGMEPILYWDLLNQKATKDYLPGDIIDEE